MTLSEFYDQVARQADTAKTQISVADTKRVLSEAFKVLEGLDAADLAGVLSKGLSAAKKKKK